MPLIEVHLIENVFDSTQKKQIIEKMQWSASKARICAALPG
jgi:phenylpyruvate tautomerase PptA (4-oxalocrotonate tautomerase family)